MGKDDTRDFEALEDIWRRRGESWVRNSLKRVRTRNGKGPGKRETTHNAELTTAAYRRWIQDSEEVPDPDQESDKPVDNHNRRPTRSRAQAAEEVVREFRSLTRPRTLENKMRGAKAFIPRSPSATGSAEGLRTVEAESPSLIESTEDAAR
jgi:hypothetical protein